MKKYRIITGILLITIFIIALANVMMSKKLNTAEDIFIAEVQNNIEFMKEIAELKTVMAEYEYILSEQNEIFNIILDKTNIAKVSGIKLTQLKTILAGTKLEGIEYALLIAERDYSINAVYLLAIAVHESDWGRSRYATERNNITGFTAYTNNPDMAKNFDTMSECILETALILKANYVDIGLVDLKSVGTKYAADVSWNTKIEIIAKGLLRR